MSDAGQLAGMRAHLFPDAFVLLLCPQIQVQLTQRRRERIRFAQCDDKIVRVLDLELIGEHLASFGHKDFEQSRFRTHLHFARRLAIHD